ncbi:16S rRNA (cytosine(967)-C(5))-methyltransferase RsmB [Candidatus Profftella armatura (Diaphorina cf. continua)]|uniref:16S rRNA (Cytosine(967)-C(5))-methyltransferase RsmB n=1 Tax=Candidatus Profftella armatura (Diaphorina cf. continua) TaxID=2661583 RepID=A0A7R7ABT5_9PROT|nr:16S rRNA (cytosine(967)-C(5))-methyltransferase RsmB [Candidatus Profftella armatura (Diaphorina cf. continua)]BCG49773.1 16S rRNA (cytosine(967)-C(5))-methyltransferase RsmB [Candidatus Profftella armatura (Diaphorina cf. continua)]
MSRNNNINNYKKNNNSLSFYLYNSAKSVIYVKNRISLKKAFSEIFNKKNISEKAKGAIKDITYYTIRHLRLVEMLLNKLIKKPIKISILKGLFFCSLALLIKTENRNIKNKNNNIKNYYKIYTIVHQSVNVAQFNFKIIYAKNMINAILRKFLREKKEIFKKIYNISESYWNYPIWWINHIKITYPNFFQWKNILDIGHKKPPLTLRINQRKTTLISYNKLLKKSGLETTIIGPLAIKLHTPISIYKIPKFLNGFSSIQDAAAQLAAPLLDIRSGMYVLDACAAPGGKTCHLLEIADIKLIAVDNNSSRLNMISENLKRLNLKATLIPLDISKINLKKLSININKKTNNRFKFSENKYFDRILADVPCTGSGVVRRNPDIPWLRRKNDIKKLSKYSYKILDNLWKMLKPGGKLLFVTCSLWFEESEEQAMIFSKNHKDSIRLYSPGQLLPTINKNQDYDGFFYSLFQKNKK